MAFLCLLLSYQQTTPSLTETTNVSYKTSAASHASHSLACDIDASRRFIGKRVVSAGDALFAVGQEPNTEKCHWREGERRTSIHDVPPCVVGYYSLVFKGLPSEGIADDLPPETGWGEIGFWLVYLFHIFSYFSPADGIGWPFS